jgi:hypothetical protein
MWSCAIGLLRFHSRGHDGSSSLLCRLVNVIVVWARPPFAVSEVLHDLDAKKAKVRNTPRIILGMGSRPSLLFSKSWDKDRLPSPLILKLILSQST